VVLVSGVRVDAATTILVAGGRSATGCLRRVARLVGRLPVPEIRVGTTEQEIESILRKAETRTDDVGHSGVGVYRAVPRWALGRQDYYIVTYDTDGRIAGYDLVENNFRGSRWTHH
jgi:hypothetical protein